MQNFTLLVGRLGLSLIFILSGISKATAYQVTAKLLVAHGLPPGLLPLVIFAELGGGLAVLCGLLTRWAAAGLFVYTLLAAVIFHNNFADHAEWINFMKNLAIAGGFLVLVVHGPGDLSLDAWRRRRRQRQKIFSA
ncbi:MAG TPA: DoxX family protein [Rhodanobacteraceae bacterium]|nr:DoxX family protein [Rhodanobacteraceae bacterium]